MFVLLTTLVLGSHAFFTGDYWISSCFPAKCDYVCHDSSFSSALGIFIQNSISVEKTSPRPTQLISTNFALSIKGAGRLKPRFVH